MDKDKNPVVRAFQMLMTVPLSADNEDEYLEMKKNVFQYLGVIAEAGNLKEEYSKGMDNNIKLLDSPEFAQFIKEKIKLEKDRKAS
jgi:hypothetical protein